MKKTSKITALIIAAVMILTFCTACGQNDKAVLTEVYDHVFDAGTYTALDYDYVSAYAKEEYDNWGGGCTAAARLTDNGTMLVGRNMDLTISNKAAYIFRTAVEGCYETVNLMYTFRDFSPDYEDVKKNGLPEDFAKIMPFMADDVLNSEGLYVEVNMRTSEFWPDGSSKFSCSGTNPDSDTDVYMFMLPRYIGEHCATVDEALEYVKTLNIYSKDGYWNYCFIMADATGHYGLLEIAQNQLFWSDYQSAQANFYVNEELSAIQEYKIGVGRYEKVMEGLRDVQTQDDMFELMDSVSYSQAYFPDECRFDYRTEFAGEAYYATYDFLTAEENRELLHTLMQANGDRISSLSRQELQDACEYWESTFTEVINCNEKTLFVRFFEDDNLTLTLGFDK